jgi:hypothetical protein
MSKGNCSVEGCNKPRLVVNPEALCRSHYDRWRRTGSATTVWLPKTYEATCPHCAAKFMVTALAVRVHVCKDCLRAYERAFAKQWYRKRMSRALAEGDKEYLDRIRSYSRQSYAVNHRLEYHSQYSKNHRDDANFRNRIAIALRTGKLTRPEACEECGSRPGLGTDGRSLIVALPLSAKLSLDVKWVCRRCSVELKESTK